MHQDAPFLAFSSDAAVALTPAARAAAPVRSAEPVAEWRPLAALGAVAPAWRDLAGRAIEANVFYEDAFALPAAPVFGADAGAVLVWADGGRTRLLGLFPARIRRGLGPALLMGWTHPYAPLGVPLVDRAAAAATVRAWLDFVAAAPGLPRLLLLPLLTAEGRFAAVLRAELARRGGRMALLDAHARALLAPAGNRAGYLHGAVSAKKRKELRRQRRRLDAQVPVRLAADEADMDLAAPLTRFLALEAAGWKGAAGTAAAQHPAIRGFIAQALGELHARGQARIMRLMQGERTVAAAILLRSGQAGWFWKIAYDEAAARASPGVQLTLELTRALLADPSLARADSCASPVHTMIDHVWRERLALADALIAPGPEAARAFAVAHRLEAARRQVVGMLKGMARRLRGRRPRAIAGKA